MVFPIKDWRGLGLAALLASCRLLALRRFAFRRFALCCLALRRLTALRSFLGLFLCRLPSFFCHTIKNIFGVNLDRTQTQREQRCMYLFIIALGSLFNAFCVRVCG